jgi:hypothetical protein
MLADGRPCFSSLKHIVRFSCFAVPVKCEIIRDSCTCRTIEISAPIYCKASFVFYLARTVPELTSARFKARLMLLSLYFSHSPINTLKRYLFRISSRAQCSGLPFLNFPFPLAIVLILFNMNFLLISLEFHVHLFVRGLVLFWPR